MWRSSPVLYEYLSKGHSHRTKQLTALTEMMAEVLYNTCCTMCADQSGEDVQCELPGIIGHFGFKS